MSLSTNTDNRVELIGLAGYLPEGHALLASCFDAHHTIGGGLFAIGDSVDEIDRISSSGLDRSGGLLYRCLWSADGSPAELVVYDETGVRRYHRLDGVSTPHDILATDAGVLVAATMQNEVQCVGAGGEVLWRWRAPGEPDSWHLNSLARYGDRTVVCGFGEFLRRRGWDESGKPATGRVVDLESGEPVLEGLTAPHNPWHDDEGWLVCDSATGDLVRFPAAGAAGAAGAGCAESAADAAGSRAERLPLPGWPRGLVVTDRYLFVGLSPHRHAATSVETAAVAVVDRRRWELVGVVNLPAREVYALVLAPNALVEGARAGFGANRTRVHEQGQWQMFDQVGVRPRRLWALGDPLTDEERQVGITVDEPALAQVEAGSLIAVDCAVRNTGTGLLTPAPPYPVRVVHRWLDGDGEEVATQQIRSALPRSLPPQGSARVTVRARVPARPGAYRLRVTLAQDGGAPFDEVDAGNAAEVGFEVVADRVDYRALAAFGLYPAQVRAACTTGATVSAVVRSLLTRPGGTPNGLVLALVRELGEDAFVAAVASVLRGSASAIRHVVLEALPDGDEARMTGAEAVALALRRAGTRVAFAYAGTSELALCDALARLGLLVNGRGDRESLFQAGGASRLSPGTGAAVLHGARGLTNALGALADVRRNEMGALAVVGLPSTGSAPFLPPHGEHGLIGASAEFAKSSYELGPVPSDPAERAVYAERFTADLASALDDVRLAPHGPVLFAVPQDVAEAEWVPLDAVPPAGEPAAPEPEAESLRAAASLVAGAVKPVVLLDDYAFNHRGVRAALAEFCAATGAPVLQVKYKRGPMLFERLDVEDVPSFLGWYDPASAEHRALLAEADLLVTVEDRNMYPRVVGPLPGCAKVAVSSKPSAVAKNGYLGPDDALVGPDVPGALRALAATAQGAPERPWYDAERVRSGAGAHAVPEQAAQLRRGVALALASAARAGRPPVLVDDSQMFGGALSEEYDSLPRGLRVFGGHGGFVGSGITVATGLALGEPGVKVFCTLGDQGFTNSMQGLVAAVQESAPVTFVVCNNGGAVSLRKQSRPSGWLDNGSHHYLDNAAGMRYAEFAEALGVRSRRVDLGDWLDPVNARAGLETFAEALRAAAEVDGPTLVELVLPGDPEFWAGVWITEGFERPAPAAVHEGVSRA
ncbi:MULTISPECIES: thiamine pyrophosphate-dependent enzyme [Actinosynnema]|uniref:thiamine pyrophosphate-dependent enzyme n=1 Tax=Actinosynnema TaxID=40566 RepID=UPI0020A422FA|nr:thiamine pyrophosphate-dependent enzyme [Actinosynnema pretiosum]MCP2098732.1 acetolactate synthase-1/2/3 large subunit [Actinosynnema pretiosum]